MKMPHITSHILSCFLCINTATITINNFSGDILFFDDFINPSRYTIFPINNDVPIQFIHSIFYSSLVVVVVVVVVVVNQ